MRLSRLCRQSRISWTKELKTPSLFREQAYIDGAWVSAKSNKTFAVTNPATDEVIANVADLSVDDVRPAIASAQRAQKEWSALLAKERSDLLRAFYQRMLYHQDDLARIMTLEQGKPLAESRGEIAYGASYLEWYAEEAKRIYGEIVPEPAAARKLLVLKQPVGVAAMITPWNFPNAMITRKMAPALAAGCAVVIKPATETPLSALAICQIASDVGLPPGLINIVPTSYEGTPAIGKLLCTDPAIRKLSFTGSTGVGKVLAAQSAGNLQRLSLELGGNAPFIVFEDADLDQAVEGAFASKFRNTGQTCVCTNRFYVHEAIYDAFVEKLAAKVARLKVGNGLSKDVTASALITTKAVEKAQRHVDDAVRKGASVVVGGGSGSGEGGGQPQLGSQFWQPTLLRDVPHDALLAQEETFGPVAGIMRFKTFEEALSLSNASPYGLASYVYTKDLQRAWRFAEKIESGMVGVNVGLISTEVAPFGGIKLSGYGREGGKWGIEEYLQTKYIGGKAMTKRKEAQQHLVDYSGMWP